MSKQQNTKFYLIKDHDKKGVEVEYGKDFECEACGRVGGYWVGGNVVLCRSCIKGLNDLIK